ncbi:hypothetical protein EUGRSUZ_K01700 [Eucalyptus grandis]|uniref:Uncharacterized protein n=2 Tax=Eucalyptus grandis TaxID=71139 RepID=A0ACC3ITV6_EUCGR|nr:hypothetical protein EUGRSUZ_K01700 [Eucalyptus grandis]
MQKGGTRKLKKGKERSHENKIPNRKNPRNEDSSIPSRLRKQSKCNLFFFSSLYITRALPMKKRSRPRVIIIFV